MKKIVENLKNNNPNYLYPFFWQHGEPNEKIKEYMDKIREQGILDLCVESRPHPEFLETGWWKSMDFIISEAKKNNMKIWILDDAKFPTGFANGKVPDDLKKKYLNYHRFDVVGPNPYAEIDLSCLAGFRNVMKDKRHLQDKIYRVILVENDTKEKDAFIEDTAIDITDKVEDKILHIALENKHYSIFALYETICGEEDATKEYLDPMRKEATQILINEVYEKHYQHYSEEFGKTIVGFFSDESRFGNMKGTEGSIGRIEMPLPWNENVIKELEKDNKYEVKDLIYLFAGNSDKAKDMRYRYMNVVTKLYSENFGKVIGDWCKEKGVDYVGHTIEDNNAHARLGYGTGHYFRGIEGQTIAGVDIIGGQVVPGMDYHHDAFSTGGSDGEFYHYALCKLGASSAKLDPNKKGVLMCEAFGAYGWIEGLKMMKWITDHMISHGVNLIVPHAFSPKEFPDWDCPPHFYAHGNNPQYPYFHNWSNYANRLCNLMSGGYQVCRVGVLYHAFAEWSGDYMPIQKVLKELQTNQIDCNIISEDYVLDADIEDNQYIINNYSYDVLVIPYAQRLPEELLNKITDISNSVKVIFINNLPFNYSSKDCEVIKLDYLSKELKVANIHEVETSSREDKLVYYHYHQDDGEVFMFSNEDIANTINTTVTLNYNKELMVYDAYENTTYKLDYELKENKLVFNLILEPYQSLVLVTGESDNIKYQVGEVINVINSDIELSLKAFNEAEYQECEKLDKLCYLGIKYPRFSGNMKYKFNIDLEDTDCILKITDVYETVEVIVNGINCGVKIVPSYDFDISKALKNGNNEIEIIVTNTLHRNQRDGFSQYIPAEPLGIAGKIILHKKL